MNESLFRLINDIGKEHTYLNDPITWFSNWAVFFLAMYMLMKYFISLKSGSHRDAVTMIIGGISFVLSFVVCKILGKLRYNEQPFAELNEVNQLVFKEVNNSFPSDHTALFFAIIFAFYFTDKKYKWLLVFPFLMGVSRIYVGVHYPMDVIIGALVAVSVSYIVVKILESKMIWLQLQHNKIVNAIIITFKKINDRAN